MPGLEGQGRSEGHVLNVTVQFMVEKLIERRNLINEIEARGGTVSDELKEYVSCLFFVPLPSCVGLLRVP